MIMTPSLLHFGLKLLFLETDGGCPNAVLSKDFWTTLHNQKPKYAIEQKRRPLRANRIMHKKECPYGFPGIYVYIQYGPHWATVNIWYIAPSHQFLKSVLSFFRFWYISKCYRFLKSVLSFSKPQLNFQKIETARIRLSINLNFDCSSYVWYMLGIKELKRSFSTENLWWEASFQRCWCCANILWSSAAALLADGPIHWNQAVTCKISIAPQCLVAVPGRRFWWGWPRYKIHTGHTGLGGITTGKIM